MTNAQIRIFGAFKNDKGNTCFITQAGIMEYDGDTLKSFVSEIDSVIKEKQFFNYAKTEFSNNFIAIGSFNGKGIYIFDRQGKILQHIDQTSGNSTSSFLFNDSNEVLWNAKIDGISKIELNTPFKIFDKRSGIIGRVRALYNYRGMIYAAGDPYVWVKTPESSKFEIVKGIPSGQYWDFVEFQDKLIVPGGSIFELSGNKGKQIVDFPNIGPPSNFHVSKQDDSILFLGLSQGNTGVRVVQYKNDQWIDKGSIPGIEEWAYDMNESPPGTLWVGTNATGAYKVEMPSYKGDFKLEDAKVSHYGPEHGLPNGEIKTPEINGKIYFSVMNDFIYRYNSETDRFLRDTIFDDAFNENSAYQWAKLKEDKKGRVWIATGKGAALATPKGDGTYAIDKPPFAHFKADMIYDFGDGDGDEVWFINEEGLVQYDPSRIHNRNKATSTIIRNIKAGDSLNLSGGSMGFKLPESTLDFSGNSIRFDFSITSYIDESQSEFQTFLEGFDKEWSTWNKNTWKEYEQLREGDYVFHVRGRNLYDQEGTQATFTFHVNPPFYRSNLAYFFYILIVIFCLEIVRRIMKRRIQNKEQQKYELMEAQAKSEKLELESELLESENNRMENELNIGTKIQMSMLTNDFPVTDKIEVFANLIPAREVGGDLYDVFFIDKDHLCCCVGDVSGKGVPAALFMAISKTLLKAISTHRYNVKEKYSKAGNTTLKYSTADIIELVNNELSSDNEEYMFVTAFLCIINVNTGETIYTSAGHNPPYVIKNGGGIKIIDEKHGLVLGAMEGVKYKESKMVLQPEDIFFIYTDGITEAFNDSHELYSEERLENLLANLNNRNVKNVVDAVIEDVERFEGNTEQTDDITVMAISYKVV